MDWRLQVHSLPCDGTTPFSERWPNCHVAPFFDADCTVERRVWIKTVITQMSIAAAITQLEQEYRTGVGISNHDDPPFRSEGKHGSVLRIQHHHRRCGRRIRAAHRYQLAISVEERTGIRRLGFNVDRGVVDQHPEQVCGFALNSACGFEVSHHIGVR
jgi:hypothetical protein